MKRNILVIDDDNDILELLEHNLNSAGYDVLGFLNTKHIRQVLKEENIDLIIIDRNLPDIEGVLYVEMLRSKNIDIPIIILSGKNSPEDIKTGFLKGADDYITKPFDIEELILRVNVLLKRYQKDTLNIDEYITYKDISLNLNMQSITIGTKNINLTKQETTLLKLLLKNKGKVLDREFLLKNAWSSSENIHKKTINVAIKRLKEKIDPESKKNYIKTVRGVGYLLS